MSKSTTKQIILTIDKGVPLPEVERPTRSKETTTRINWSFLEMDHGDSFLMPEGYDKAKAYTALTALKRRDKISTETYITARKEGNTYRIWLFKDGNNGNS